MVIDQIQHVFVLMLENRSLDHLLGFCGISGLDAVSGLTTAVNGLSSKETNTYSGSSEEAGPFSVGDQSRGSCGWTFPICLPLAQSRDIPTCLPREMVQWRQASQVRVTFPASGNTD